MQKFLLILVFCLTLAIYSLGLSKVSARDPYTCDNPAWEYSTYSAACIPKECPAGTHYSYTGTVCICNDETLKACTDPETNITSKCIPANESCTKAEITPTTTTTTETITGTVVKVTGDVTYRPGGIGEERPLTPGMTIHKGDAIMTGFDSGVLLNFGDFTQVSVHSLTGIRIDDYFSKDNIDKTKLYLNVGAISAKVRRTPSIRSDFSVQTYNASSSIRGSEMIVAYDEDSVATTVYAVEDTAYVLGSEDTVETEIPAGKMIYLSDSAAVPTIDYFTTDELPLKEVAFNNWSGVFDTVETSDAALAQMLATWGVLGVVCLGLVCLALVGVVVGLIVWRKRQKN